MPQMGRHKHFGHLLTQTRQVVDLEKAPIIDLVRRDTPVRQSIGLHLQQCMQRIITAGPAAMAVEGSHRLGHKLVQITIGLAQPGEAS